MDRRHRRLLATMASLLIVIGVTACDSLVSALPRTAPSRTAASRRRTAPIPTTTSTTAPAPDNPAAPVSAIGPWRGVYTPHGWVATPKSSQQISDAVHAIGAAGFNRQIANIGAFDANGNMPLANYAGLNAWVTTSRSVDPGQGIIAWVSGSESTHVNNPATHANIAAWIAGAVNGLGVDGVMLDFEPFTRDNPKLLQLLDTIRVAAPGAWIGIDAPAQRWSEPFITAVGSRVNALSPMLYDQGLTSAGYVDLVTRTIVGYSRAAPAVLLTPSLPAYLANPWHDPTVENIDQANRGIRAAVPLGARVDGAAVYWWWEMTPDDLAQWSQAIDPASG